jgi:hypothetical protein
MNRRFVVPAALALLLGGSVEKVRAGSVVMPGAVTISVTDDPAGGSFTGTVTPSAGGTVFDNGLLTLSETITPVNATSAWAVFHVNTTAGQPLVGSPAGYFDITISGIQTKPAALTAAFIGFDVNGTDDSFPFPGSTTGPNPITGTGSVANYVYSPPYTSNTSQYLFATISPYDQGPTDFGNSPSNTPTGYTIGGLYALQTAVPEPGSLTLAGLAAVGFAVRTWRRRLAR